MILMIMMSVSLSANFKQQQVAMLKSAYDIRSKGPTLSNVKALTLKMTPSNAKHVKITSLAIMHILAVFIFKLVGTCYLKNMAAMFNKKEIFLEFPCRQAIPYGRMGWQDWQTVTGDNINPQTLGDKE